MPSGVIFTQQLRCEIARHGDILICFGSAVISQEHEHVQTCLVKLGGTQGER